MKNKLNKIHKNLIKNSQIIPSSQLKLIQVTKIIKVQLKIHQTKKKQQTVEITAFHTDEKGNNASEIKKDESASLMAGQGLLKETKTFSWNGQIKGSSDSETEQTKTISYVINHI